MKNLFILCYSFFSISAFAASSYLNIEHCYHWLDQEVKNRKFLDNKYRYAKKHEGELTFYTKSGTSKGAMAGEGLYCAQTPYGSRSYGDRIIKVTLVDDIVLSDQGRTNHCKIDGVWIKGGECNNKAWDIKYYRTDGTYRWYVLKNKEAVKSWSSGSQDLIDDLGESKQKHSGDYAFGTKVHNLITNLNLAQKNSEVIYNFKSRQNLMTEILNGVVKLEGQNYKGLISNLESLDKLEASDEWVTNIYNYIVEQALVDQKIKILELKKLLKSNVRLAQETSKKASTLLRGDEWKDKNVFSLLYFSNRKQEIEEAKLAEILSFIFEEKNNFKKIISFHEAIKTTGLKGQIGAYLILNKKFNSLASIADFITYLKLVRTYVDMDANKDFFESFITVFEDKFNTSVGDTSSLIYLEIAGRKTPLIGTKDEALTVCELKLTKNKEITGAYIKIGEHILKTYKGENDFCELSTDQFALLTLVDKSFGGVVPKYLLHISVDDVRRATLVNNTADILAQYPEKRRYPYTAIDLKVSVATELSPLVFEKTLSRSRREEIGKEVVGLVKHLVPSKEELEWKEYFEKTSANASNSMSVVFSDGYGNQQKLVTFKFPKSSRDIMRKQCEYYYRLTIADGRVSSIAWNLNGRKKGTFSTYARDEVKLCRELETKIIAHMPSAEVKTWLRDEQKRKKTKSYYVSGQVTGIRSGKVPMSLAFNHLGELKTRCEVYYNKFMQGYSRKKVILKLGKNKSRIHIKAKNYSSAGSFCGDLKGKLKNRVMSEKEWKWKENEKSRNKNYSIAGIIFDTKTIGKKNDGYNHRIWYRFSFNRVGDFKSSCNSFARSIGKNIEYNRIQWKMSNSRKAKVYTVKLKYSKSYLCDDLAKIIEKNI